jgi:MFS family permease
MNKRTGDPADIDSARAWFRLLVSLVVTTIGGAGMYVVVVVLPEVQSEFGVARADASLPYTLTLVGYGVGSILMGRLTDRFGVAVPTMMGAVCLGLGFVLAGAAGGIAAFALLQGVLIGIGSSASFVPLLADVSFWFAKRRGIAVAIAASGNYLGGTLWPPVVQHFVETSGWRATYFGIGVFCAAALLLLSLGLRRARPPQRAHATTVATAGSAPATAAHGDPSRPLGMSSFALTVLLSIAGVACCVAMSMPQVHIVAYCGDLGYGAARGAQMLSLMLGFGIVSRLVFGMISDRIGGLRTLALGSALQTLALVLFLPFDELGTLYVVSALFGLFQGGIVPSYAIIVREHFPPTLAGSRVGIVLTATMLGMALGGWMSGKIFDLTGSYDAAFVNGIAWNLLNLAIVLLLLRRARPPRLVPCPA